jgi:hypothetical protein
LTINLLNKHFILNITRSLLLLLLLVFFGAWLHTPLKAQYSSNGFLQNYTAIQTTGEHEFIAARNRLRLQISRRLENGNLYTETDFIQRFADSESVELQFKELYFDWYFDNSDLRLGKQKITWGRANGAFVTDILSPLDLREFLTQDPSDIIIGVTALNLTRYFGANSMQFVYNPVFQQNQLPDSDSRWFPLQTIEVPLNLPVNFRGNQKTPSIRNVQAATRFALRPSAAFDLDLMLMHWTHPVPAYALNINLLNFSNPLSIDLTESYIASPMAGYSFEWRLHRNLSIQSEMLYVHERLFTFLPVSVNQLERALDDPAEVLQLLQDFEFRDDGYLLTKPWLHSMIGLQTEIAGTTVNVQAYLETIFNYEERILPQRLFPYVNLLVNRSFLRDRLQMISIGRYNIYGDDFWIQLQGVYELADDLEIALGTNLFGGEMTSPFYGHFTFNQFRENSFIFSRIALYF